MKSKLNLRRKDLGLSTTELSHRLGISQSSVVRLEQSEAAETITLASLKKVAEALGCTLNYTLTPLTKTKSKKAYYGMKRSRFSASMRSKSTLSEALRKDVERNSQRLSAVQRIEQACSLSDLTKELRCLKKH